MPELPEVEYSRRVWDAGLGQRVLKVLVPHPDVRDFRARKPGGYRASLLIRCSAVLK
jgi:formamidopyrimidine-DNA glycosylase